MFRFAMHEQFVDSLPDMTDPALTERIRLGGRRATIQVSRIRQFDDYGPGVDVVHAWAVRPDGTPLTLHDLRPLASAQEAYNLWSFLCEQLSVAATLVYGLRPSQDGSPNPRLGCWGPRPDLAGPEADDRATALVVGVAVDTEQAMRQPREDLLTLSIRSAFVVALRRWTEEAERDLAG